MDDDLYGNLGVVADPTWLEKIHHWTIQEREERLYQAGGWPFLNPTQVAAVLKGEPPPPSGWPDPPYVLDEAAGACARWTADLAAGKVSRYVKPNELAAWCDHHRFELPEPFVRGVHDFYVKQCAPIEQAAEPIDLPPWVVITPQAPASPPRLPVKRGRKAVMDANNRLAIAEANRLYHEHAARGKVPSQAAIVKELAKQNEFSERSRAALLRAITGQVDRAKAQASAARVQQTQRKSIR